MHFQCFEWRFECVLMSLISPRSNHLDFVWKLIVSGNCVFSALLWSCVRSGILPLRRANDIYWCKYFLEIHCHWILRSRRCHYQSPWLCFANKSTVITNLVLIHWYGEEKNFNWTRGLNSKNINAFKWSFSFPRVTSKLLERIFFVKSFWWPLRIPLWKCIRNNNIPRLRVIIHLFLDQTWPALLGQHIYKNILFAWLRAAVHFLDKDRFLTVIWAFSIQT